MLSLLASRTHNGVLITDAQRRVQWVNDSFTRMTGYTLDEVRDRVADSFSRTGHRSGDGQCIGRQFDSQQGFTTEIPFAPSRVAATGGFKCSQSSGGGRRGQLRRDRG